MDNTMLTTIDNPFNPFTEFTEWYMFDVEHGYNTSSRIARLMPNDSSLSQTEIDRIQDQIMSDIIKYDPFGIYTKVDETTAVHVASNAKLFAEAENVE